ncbi:acetyl-CoA carboxylase, carboxyltransferase subunit beta [Micromonospora sp. WMMD1102]|uniref:acetyl-CoA carboxylase, carboxyltransferase subunit beta n=1 Tax=Micromonospora sp. WMMD1102 TaxID=3016105 RepID=UPI002414EAC0|nr:acetyl-CoA carboxylase, carboxyltransferase subunit beta [Micromonospora sp. WMMD1102]MDG4786427.1 acetyl-CoA carboxylase, carboxyltransferase subunit beta [Micromonospora sp. WMMD1102]
MGASTLDLINGLPDGVWQPCPRCTALLHRDRLARALHTCPECGHHLPLRAEDRIALLVDPDSFVEHDADLAAADPLEFTDRMPYPQRLARARARTGRADGAVLGLATIGGHRVALVVLDFAFLGGSMGSVVGEKVARAAETALDHGVPLVAVSASGGARMQEGVLSLLQMAKTAAAIRLLRDAGVPYVSVLTDPVYGGVAASFASLGDVIVAEEGTRAGFAGPRVIEQTIRQPLPAGFQTARFLHEHGHVDLVVRRAELRGVLARLVGFFAAARASSGGPLAAVGTAPGRPVAAAGRRTSRGAGHDDRPERSVDAWTAVGRARAVDRPTVRQHIERIFGDFVELHGDRWERDDPAIVGGLARLDGVPVVLVGHAKGRDTRENVANNFGMPHPAGYRKVMRLFELAQRWGVPVVTLVDTPGAYPGLAAEEGNQSGAIAETLALAAGLRTPVVAVITGEGGSGGALALAVADRLLIQENGVFSVISPEGCAAILFGDAGQAPVAARALRLRAEDLGRLGVVDEILPEPPGDPDRAAELVAEAVGRLLRQLAAVPVEELLAARYRRLRGYGVLAPEGAAAGSAVPEPWKEGAHV